MIAPPVVVLRSDPLAIEVMANFEVVALVAVALPVMTRLPLNVEEADTKIPTDVVGDNVVEFVSSHDLPKIAESCAYEERSEKVGSPREEVAVKV